MDSNSYKVYKVVDVCLDSETDRVVLYLRCMKGRRFHIFLNAQYDVIVGVTLQSQDAEDSAVYEVSKMCKDCIIYRLGMCNTYYRGERYLIRAACRNFRSYNRLIDNIKFNHYTNLFICDMHSSVETKTLMKYNIYGSNYIRHYTSGLLEAASSGDEFEYKPRTAGIDLEMLSLDYADPNCRFYMASYYSDTYRAVIYASSYCGEVDADEKIEYIRVATKFDVAIRLANIIAEQKPDIVTGYNIYNADIPLLYYTLRQALCRWTRMNVGAEPYFHQTRKLEKHLIDSSAGTAIKIPGCQVIDMYAYLDKMLVSEEKNDMRLGEVSARHLGTSKDPFSYRDLHRIYHSGTLEERKLVMRYCLRDSELSVKLYEKFNVWNHHWSIYGISAVEPQRSLSTGVVDVTYGSCISICKQLNVYIDSPYNRVFKPGGGMVFSSIKGFYSNVMCVDFTSLYPNIVIQHNIDSLSVVDSSREMIEKKHGLFIAEYYYEITEDRKVIGLRDSRDSNVYFLIDTPAVLPTLLLKLLDERAMMKNRLKSLEKKSFEYLVLSGQEQARKECANGACGALAEATEGNPLSYCELNDIITTTGRSIIGIAAEVARMNGYVVIYGDTDSLFISTNRNIEEYLSMVHMRLPARIRFKVEYKAERFIMGSKKHYIAKIGDVIKIAGYKAVKSSSCKAVQMLFKWLVEIMLNSGQDEAMKAYYEALETYSSIEYDPDMTLFVTRFSYRGKVYAANTYRYKVIYAMRSRGVELAAGNTLQIITVKTMETFIRLYGCEPPIKLPNDSSGKADRIFTLDEVEKCPQVVDVRDIIETQCGECLRMLLYHQA